MWISVRCRNPYKESPTLFPEVSRRQMLVGRRSEADLFRCLGRHLPSSSLGTIYQSIYNIYIEDNSLKTRLRSGCHRIH